jgi:hypothetical protein
MADVHDFGAAVRDFLRGLLQRVDYSQPPDLYSPQTIECAMRSTQAQAAL